MASYDAFGTIWSIEFVAATFTPVGQVTNIDVLDIDVDTIDVSSHSSTGQWREFVAGMKDAGELSMDLNLDPATHMAATDSVYAQVGGDPIGMKITLPDTGAAEIAFDGIVTGFSASAPYDDKLEATATVKVTGPITVTL